ncbi:hypothetical protein CAUPRSCDRAFT_11096 [Caulochytrium protostelioides]|uniref:Uncharacterized protein n=1 Tax=Caulochytrium protostelioides TaxID=1555241 RepID=A0A4P9WXY7_9FUNG|nr:hypothetical protein CAUPRSCDRAFT_11096 [Caulochytrium protostelioides]
MASSVATTPPQYPRWDGPVCRSNAWLFCPKRWRRQSGTMSHHVLLPATHRTHQHARSKTYHAASSASLFSTAAHAGGADGAHRSYSSTSPTAHDDAGAHGGHRRAASMLLMPPLASSSAATAETWPMNFCPPRPTDASLPAIPASLETTSPWMDDAAVGLHGTVAAALSPVAMPTASPDNGAERFGADHAAPPTRTQPPASALGHDGGGVAAPHVLHIPRLRACRRPGIMCTRRFRRTVCRIASSTMAVDGHGRVQPGLAA